MNISVHCPGCGQTLAAPPHYAGRRVGCPKCKAPIDVPLLAAPLPPAPTIAFEPGAALNPTIPQPPRRAAATPPPLPAQPRAAAPWKPESPPAAVPPALPVQQRSNSPWSSEAPPGAVSPPALPVAVRAAAAPAGSGSPLGAKPRQRGGRWIPVAAIAAVLLLGGGAAAWIFLFSNHGVGNDLRFLPDDTDLVVSLDVNGIITSSAGQKIKTAAAEMFGQLQAQMRQDSTIKPEDVGRITVGYRLRAKQGTGVVHFNRPISEQDLPHPDRGTKKTVGPYQIQGNVAEAYCLIDSQTVAVGDRALLQKVLERDGPAKLSGDLTAAMSEVDFSKSFAAAGATVGIPTASKGADPLAGMGLPPDARDAFRGFAFQGDAGDDLRFQVAVLWKDAATAEQYGKMAEGAYSVLKLNPPPAMPPGAGKIIDSVRISYSGNVVRGSATVEVDTIVTMLQPLMMALPRARAGLPTSGGAKSPANNPPKASEAGDWPPIQRPTAPGALQPKPHDDARQAQATNDLRQIGLALLSAQQKEGRLPAAAICDAQGNPLLSWRVALLPYLGEDELYKKFHLDEPWDSPNNIKLKLRMPRLFRGRHGGFGKTPYLAAVGEKYAFFGRQRRALAEFQDGLSQTILIVEAVPANGVIWTKPADLEFNAADPRSGLFGPRDDACLALFGDGHVDSIRNTTSDDVLRALFTIAGGETIPPNFGAP